MKSWKKTLSLWITLLFMVCLSACGAAPKESEPESASIQLDGDYTIYTISKDGLKLSGYGYNSKATGDALIKALIEEVKNASGSLKQRSALPENLYVLDYELTNRVLYLFFDGNYREMDTTTEVLCRAALAKTLTQVAGVDYISVYVDNQPLMDAGGAPMGYVTGDDFIENASDIKGTEKTATFTLYFANQNGTKLVKESRQVQITNQATAMERMVINEVLAGPKEEGHYATLPTIVKVNGVQVKNGICYVNLSGAFVNDALNISEYVAVYSLVNSLVELNTVNKVQIMIDGSSAITFRGSISFEKPLERKLDCVE